MAEPDDPTSSIVDLAEPADERRAPTRRTALVLGSGLAVGAVGAVVLGTGRVMLPGKLGTAQRSLGGRLDGALHGTESAIPDAPEGQVTVSSRDSAARGTRVGVFTAIPAGLGSGAGLPVCLVLHGASATTADFQRFGLAQQLTAAIQAGAPPFVLMGADGGDTWWRKVGADDAVGMVTRELPAWAAERGFDSSRLAVYGWSRGGVGSLDLAADVAGGQARFPAAARARSTGSSAAPGLRAIAVLSPAVDPADPVMPRLNAVRGAGVGVWCGSLDGLLAGGQAAAAAVGGGAAVASWTPGSHTRLFWDSVTPQAFAFIAAALAKQ